MTSEVGWIRIWSKPINQEDGWWRKRLSFRVKQLID